MTVVNGRSSTVVSDRILVAGIYLADQENAVDHVVSELDQSTRWNVDQRWIAIGGQPPTGRLAEATQHRIDSFVPKFTLLNRLLTGISIADFAFVILCDDDIRLPARFLDTYLALVQEYDFALSQPARTHDSYIDHPFVEQFDGLQARQTRFVEIGPLAVLRRDAAELLLPFDEQSPMGWGYDLAWPCVLERAALRLGIVDAVPVAHSIRKPVAHYDHATADSQMMRFLKDRPHLSKDEAFFIVEAYS